MSILTNEDLKLRKEEAHKRELRQNVKSHCTKIRDGIRKNGSTSGNRAIWELFQNAGDLAKDGSSAEIRIILNEDTFIFAHKGKSFTYDSLCSLVKQVSSQEKEDDDTVGQYGTGFLTTHKFGRKIVINGSMLISENPMVYVDIDDFLINRENFDNIPLFIEDMTAQIMRVHELMDAEQKHTPKEWTELSYELSEERKIIAQTAIDEAIKLMPYVLTFNASIGCCTIDDNTRSKSITFRKKDEFCSVKDLLCKRIMISEKGKGLENFDCFYLQMHEGDSRIILPLKSETQVCSFGNVPRLFVHFPLIGQNYFGVNFLFHSHRFTPEEPRDNIIVPKDNDATDKAAIANKQVLDEMTKVLWNFLEAHVYTWIDTINMASLHIKDSGYSEEKTEKYYKELKASWVSEFLKLKLIDAKGTRYSMNDENHPVVLEPSLEAFISDHEDTDYLSVIYPYAEGTTSVPRKEELLQWSKIIAEWAPDKTEYFLTLESIVEYVSSNQGTTLHDMLQMIVEAGHSEFFAEYALLPNREGILMKRGELRDAKPIVPRLYKLVKDLNCDTCKKFVHEDYADIIDLTAYDRSNLREELNATIKAKEDDCWNDTDAPTYYEGDFERHLIALCSSFTIIEGDSKRHKLMPIICKFEGIEYCKTHIPAWPDDAVHFDLYRQIFVSLVENQMMKIQQKDSGWVKENFEDLRVFVDNARGDDYKNFCTQYAIYPDMNGELHKPEELKRNDEVPDKLFDFYQQVLGEDLKSKCVDESFASYYANFADDAYKYTAKSVAKEIQNELSANHYQDTVLLDIIELTEDETDEGLQWRILFKDIYDQRESIRYNLGSESERKAINKMLKQKNPVLMEKMAEISERIDANAILDALNDTIHSIEHDEYIKRLGAYVEGHIKIYLEEAFAGTGITVSNQQCGQDFILSKDGYDDYYIEVKSRWESDQSVEMTVTQFNLAVEEPERYALLSVNMYHFDRLRVEQNDPVALHEIYSNIKCLDNIGFLEKDLKVRADEAFKGGENDIRLDGAYKVRAPQSIFDANQLDFNGLLGKIISKFS